MSLTIWLVVDEDNSLTIFVSRYFGYVKENLGTQVVDRK